MTVTDAAEGRGRLSSIDMLPEDAEPDILWANEQLRAREKPANAILAEFNARLADRGIGAISKSAWGRYSVRKAVQFRKHDEARRMSAELVAQLGSEGADEVTVMVAEMAKVAALEILETGKLDSKSFMELGKGLQSVVGAQKASAEHRRKLREDMLAKVDKAIDKAGAESGGADAAAVLKRIREDVYGIFAS
ncbi:MAG: phage protein Gp27 family protein [Pseudomonadota bacterium]